MKYNYNILIYITGMEKLNRSGSSMHVFHSRKKSEVNNMKK
jgi:hypothetical protein